MTKGLKKNFNLIPKEKKREERKGLGEKRN